MSATATKYTEQFYSGQMDGSLRSARVIAAVLAEFAPVKRVLDVGCGVGGWLRAFQELGAEEIRGVDGAYVNRSQLLVPQECFTPCDLADASSLPTGFDLAVCAEVLEHLPEAAGERLVGLMTKSAPLVLFSAAIPGQGGTHHINERWHHHWHEKFSRHGFTVLDVIRPRVFADASVEWWYRQNMFLYASEPAFDRWPALRQLQREPSPAVVPIDPRVLSQFTSIRGLLRHLTMRLKQRILG